ncbi:50S ribosomal protein L15 [Candidatus Peregrinibacteria bacterium]|nr:50S ribosomal protein L15 [Candidatus Peregrinibacteria bacterium]
MTLHNLKSKVTQKKKRIGRGNGSKMGTYSCKGMKGQTARTGGKRRPGFEGGQTPFLRKMPKLKGFKNPNYVDYQVVNVGDLEIFDDKAEVTIKELLEKNLVSKKDKPVKLLGGKGELKKSITISVDRASASAIKQVEKAKGKVILPSVKKEKTEKPKNPKKD